MRVIVRVRPHKDGNSDARSLVKVLDCNELIFDPKEEVEEFYYHGQVTRNRDVLRRQHRDARFTFDYVFGADSNNEQVYEESIKTILDGFLDGYNCCVFAYGATGSGKTYTMLGTAQSSGITFLTMMELYSRIEMLQEDRTCELAITYLEIYNETIRDLLMPTEPLLLREDNQRGVIIPGLTFHKPKSAEELLSMLDSGNKNRTQHPTDANSESSRSHAVFTVYLKQRDKNKISMQMRNAKLSLIDLAGSERAAVVNHRGARLREGANINKSLLALGNCINALADRKTNGQHVPYRDSKLTRLLKGSLGGNCCTVMIAAVSPSLQNFEDTYNTLKYAVRAKAIKNISKQNIVTVDSNDRSYKQALDAALKELAELKKKLKEMTEKPTGTESRVFAPPAQDLKFSPAFVAIYEERISLMLSQAKAIWQHSKLDLKIVKHIVAVEQISQVAEDRYLGMSAGKADHAIIQMKAKQDKLAAEKASLEILIVNNNNRLDALRSQVQKYYPSGLPQNLSDLLENLELKLQLKLSEAHNKHLRMQANDCQSEENRYKSIVVAGLALAKNYQLCLKRNNVSQEDLVEELNALLKKLKSFKSVSFAVVSPTSETKKRRMLRSPKSESHPAARKLKIASDENANDPTEALNTTITITSPLAVHQICQNDEEMLESTMKTGPKYAVSLFNGDDTYPPTKAGPSNYKPNEKLPGPETPKTVKLPLTASSLMNIRSKFKSSERSKSTSELQKIGSVSSSKVAKDRNIVPNKNATTINNRLKTCGGSKSSSDIRQRTHPYFGAKQLVSKHRPTNSSENVPDVKFTPKTMNRLRSSKSALNLQFPGNTN